MSVFRHWRDGRMCVEKEAIYSRLYAGEACLDSSSKRRRRRRYGDAADLNALNSKNGNNDDSCVNLWLYGNLRRKPVPTTTPQNQSVAYNVWRPAGCVTPEWREMLKLSKINLVDLKSSTAASWRRESHLWRRGRWPAAAVFTLWRLDASPAKMPSSEIGNAHITHPSIYLVNPYLWR